MNGLLEAFDAFDPQKVQKRYRVPEVMALEAAIDEALTAAFGHGTVEYRRYSDAATLDHGPRIARLAPAFGSGYAPNFDASEAHDARRYFAEGKEQSIVLLRQAIRSLEEEIAGDDALPHALPPQPDATLPNNAVFVVHGHDEGPREAVARFIERLGFNAIILHERPNKGRTIISKFREEAVGVGFAVVLITPDDVGRAIEESELRPRARQNVIFELGFFVGALGPERVAALVKGDVELPSDYDGVVYISMENEDWRTKLAKELQAARYEIDWNKVMKP